MTVVMSLVALMDACPLEEWTSAVDDVAWAFAQTLAFVKRYIYPSFLACLVAHDAPYSDPPPTNAESSPAAAKRPAPTSATKTTKRRRVR